MDTNEMDPSLKYSEIVESSESNPVVDLLKKPTRKPRMVFRKSKVLARVMELLPRLQAESIPESKDMNIENCSEDEPYIELNPIGFTKEPENESEPKMVILHESGNGESSEDEGVESSGDESKAVKALIEDITEQTLNVIKENEEDLPSIQNEKVSTSDRTEDSVSPVKKRMKMEVTPINICEELVH